MKTAKEREEAFRADLAELLRKHDAEMKMTDDGKPWGLASPICHITIMNQYDATGKEISGYTEFNL